jgi:two-component system, OmpR family, response regulator
MFALVVEDEPQMARLISERLGRSGFETEVAPSLSAAREAMVSRFFRVVLLDRRLPDGDGLSLMPCLRETSPEACIFVLSALDETSDRISGFEAGADDYIAKPFDGDELIVRILARLKRLGAIASPVMRCGRLSFDPSSREVIICGQPALLHRRELLLLETLLRSLDRATSRAQLFREVYGLRNGAEHENTLDVLVSRLRRRLQELDAGVAIHTARGIGYLLTEVPANP